jgi:hypothetical protein
MSEENLFPVLAAIGFNDGANKGFWRVQPREQFGDGAGQWIEMGAELRMFFKNKRGQTANVTGRAVGSTGTPDGVRVLVQGQKDVPDGIYGASTSSVRVAEGFIPDKVLKEQGIQNTVKISKEQEASLPTIESLERADITGEDLRLINEGANSKEGKQHAEYRKAAEAKSDSEPDPAGDSVSDRDGASSAIQDLMGDVAFGDDVPDLDSLIKFAKSPPKDANIIQTKKRFPIELEPGMVVRDKGVNFVVQDKPKQAGTTRDGRRVTSFSVVEEGKKEVRSVRVDGEEPVNILVGPDNKTPIKRDVVSPEVAKPATPETPSKPSTPKPPSNRKARVNQLLKKYKDNGKDIAPAAKSREELYDKVITNEIDPETGELIEIADADGNPRPLNSANAIEDAIFEENPNAKIRPDGSIVIERGRFTDTDGREYAYEVRVDRTQGNQFMERYIFSDPETKEVLYDYYNSDYKDSFSALYGKSNGVVVTRDFFLGSTVPGNKGVDAEGVPNDKELRSYFGPNKTIANRVKYLLKKQGARRESRILTPEDNRRRFLDGYGLIYNMADTRTGRDGQNSTLGTVARPFVANIYELIAGKDIEVISAAFKQAMGRLPDNDESTTDLLNSFKEGVKENFAGTPDYPSIIQLPRLLAAALVQENLDIRNISKIPFVSQDGVTPLFPGSYVKFFNNEDGVSVGRVVRLVSGSGKNGNYKDTVVVKYADRTVPNLQTRNMKPLTDEELDLTVVDNDNLLTNYVGQLEGPDMREVRLGIDYRDLPNRKEDSPDDGPDDINDSGNAGAPYLGSDGKDGNDSNNKGGGGIPVEELTPGDSLYSADGEFLGTVIDVQPVPSADGGEPGYAVAYSTPEGDEGLDVLDAGEVRSPK